MFNPLQAWIDNVCASHSDSNRTRQGYLLIFQGYSKFIDRTAIEIIREYEKSTDRDFKRKHAQYVKAFISAQQRNGIAPSTISMRVGVIRSFYKYNDLPLGFIPAVKARMLYHNRDITHEEVKLILDSSRPRERAFFALMAQSGIRPNTICNLKYENIKEDFEKNVIPCKIDIPQEIAKGKYHSYFTFIGEEAVRYLRSYLVVRPKINDEDYLFLNEGTREKANPKSISRFFARTVQKLNEKGLMKVKQKKETKPHDVRLYNLRKFFRKYANQAGFEFVQFWMGHTVNAGQDEHYRPKDVEFHRKLYAEKAMPHLRIETATPTETDKAITALEEENRELKDKLERLENVMEEMQQRVFGNDYESDEKLLKKVNPKHREKIERIVEHKRQQQEYLANRPEEHRKQEEEALRLFEKLKKVQRKNATENEQIFQVIEEEIIRIDERRKTLRELEELIKKTEDKESRD